MTVVFRPYQSEILDKIRDAFKHGANAPLLVLPTGGGKTTIFSGVTHSANEKKKCVFILAHRAELVKQIADTLARFNVKHNIVAPNSIINQCRLQQWKDYGQHYVDIKSVIVVASVQTLVRRLDKTVLKPDLIICDESHHLTNGSTWGKCIDHFKTAKLLLVTATPCRLDGRGLGKQSDGYADNIIIGQQMRWLIDNGYLSEFKIYAPPINLDLRDIKSLGGDYKKNELSAVMDKPKITGDVVEHYKRLATDKRAIVFCCSVKHSEHISEAFNNAGIVAESLDGSLDAGQRETMIARFKSGETKILTSCEIVSEGFDLPAIEVAILLRPTQSLSLYMQQVGRALRLFEGKTHAIIIDHVGNVMRHGWPDDIREWSLDGEVKKNKTNEPDVKIKTCKFCFAIFKPAPICPQCHTRVEFKDRKIEEESGVLIELTRDQKQAIKEAEIFEKLVMAKERKKEEWQCKTLDDLIQLGYDRGYQFPEKWAEKRFSFRKKTA